jgi:serine/threonine protein kinase
VVDPPWESAAVPLPERLGRLERRERLGVGGFATVWLYHDSELDSDVAVKALAENWAQRLDVRERFLEEARILRRADSDHVVRVHDIGEADGTPYFVMTYADRGSLAQLLEAEAGRPLPVPVAVDLVAQAASGLRVLHELGVVHRDVKPQNLLLRSGGSAGDRLLVADLGVAKAMLHASGLTQVVGTPAYMAPEQAFGEGVDTRADVHALGAVAYQLLTGHQARELSIPELAHAGSPVPPSQVEPSLPVEVDAVLLRALDPSPEVRHPDVDAFVADLCEALAPELGPDGTTRVEPRRTLAEPVAGPVPEPVAVPAGGRLRLALVCLLVFLVTFAAAYVVARALS